MLTIRKILHPTDLSERSKVAFQAACSLARDYHARLIVLHVVPLPVVMYGPPPASFLDHLHEELCRIRPGDPNTHVQYLLAEGDPANAILSAAGENHCDLIVMGTHGRCGLGRLVMGSVAEAIIRGGSTPVLVCPPAAVGMDEVSQDDRVLAAPDPGARAAAPEARQAPQRQQLEGLRSRAGEPPVHCESSSLPSEGIAMNADVQLQREVVHALEHEPEVTPGEVAISVRNGAVDLSGVVQTFFEKCAAERAALRVPGVRAVSQAIRVGLEEKDGDRDMVIAEAVARALQGRADVPTNVRATVEGGWVTLRGEVATQAQWEAALDAVQHGAGVERIYNLVTIKPTVPPAKARAGIEEPQRRNSNVEAECAVV